MPKTTELATSTGLDSTVEVIINRGASPATERAPLAGVAHAR